MWADQVTGLAGKIMLAHCIPQVDTVRLVQKSATVAGFFLSHFAKEMQEVLPELMQLIQQGENIRHVLRIR